MESYRYRAHWLEARHTFTAHFSELPQSEVVHYRWPKWVVRKGPSNTLVLESVRYPNHFLDASHTGFCYVTYSAFPYDKNWALWYLEYSSGRFAFRSKRYSDSRLDASHTGPGDARITKGSGIWSQMRVYQPDLSERRALIFTHDNSDGTSPVIKTFTEKLGISRTDTSSTSYTISTELGLEIKSIFSAKASHSQTWAQSTSTTWTKETSWTVEIIIAPFTIKKVYQLQGSYGPFDVAADYLWYEG